MKFIEQDRLIVGVIYPVNCRNFSLGIYIQTGPGTEFSTFEGIREKFGYRFVTREFGRAFDWPIGKDEIVALAEHLKGLEVTQSDQWIKERAEDEADGIV